MKNKRSLFAVPYVGWMALFVVAPIVMVVIYAFSSAGGGFTLEHFASMGTYASVFTRSFWQDRLQEYEAGQGKVPHHGGLHCDQRGHIYWNDHFCPTDEHGLGSLLQ